MSSLSRDSVWSFWVVYALVLAPLQTADGDASPELQVTSVFLVQIASAQDKDVSLILSKSVR